MDQVLFSLRMVENYFSSKHGMEAYFSSKLSNTKSATIFLKRLVP